LAEPLFKLPFLTGVGSLVAEEPNPFYFAGVGT